MISNGNKNDSTDEKNKAIEDLIGKGFKIIPVLYDGLTIDESNTSDEATKKIKDDKIIGYYKDNSTIRYYRIEDSKATPEDVKYNLSDGFMNVDNHKIPYKIEVNAVITKRWDEKTSDNHVITYELEPDSNAKTEIEKLE